MKEILDTIYIVKTDTITNTEIIYHETVKLIESDGNLVGIYMPIFIAILALGFSAWQFYIARKDRKINSTPLIYFYDNYPLNGLELEIRNNGLGVAIVKKVDYKYKNESYKNILEIIAKITDIEALVNNEVLSTEEGSVFVVDEELYIEQNGKLPLFDLRFKTNDLGQSLYEELQTIEITVAYTNAYSSIEEQKTKKLDFLQKTEKSLITILTDQLSNNT